MQYAYSTLIFYYHLVSFTVPTLLFYITYLLNFIVSQHAYPVVQVRISDSSQSIYSSPSAQSTLNGNTHLWQHINRPSPTTRKARNSYSDAQQHVPHLWRHAQRHAKHASLAARTTACKARISGSTHVVKTILEL